MTFPAFIFGVLVALIYGALFHIWKNGGLGKLVLYLFLSVAGFFVGQWVGTLLGTSFIEVGPVHLGFASLGSFAFLLIGNWLSQVEVARS